MLQRNSFIFLLLLTFAFLLYFPVYSIGFISDDWGFVYQAKEFGWSAFKHNFADTFFIPASHFLGLLWYKISAGNQIILHVIQLLFQVLVAFQIFALFKDLSKIKKNDDLILIGFIASLLFISNPFQTESVVWLASKSYQYVLLTGLIALRVIVSGKLKNSQKTFLYPLMLLLAIHFKEWAYILPVITWIVVRYFKITLPLRIYIFSGAVILGSLLLRFYVLGTFIGGYGSEVHSFGFSNMLYSIAGHGFKFFSYYRYSSSHWLLLILTVISVLGLFVLAGIRTKKKKELLLSGIALFGIFIFCLLPISNLETSSFGQVQSDRYSYFALIPFSIAFAWALLQIGKSYRMILVIAILAIQTTLTLQTNFQWQTSYEIQIDYLENLEKEVSTDTRVLLLNVPDTYRGIYCLRNGIEPYLKVHDKYVDIEVFQHQDFLSKDGGLIVSDSSTFQAFNAINTFTTHPKESKTPSKNFDPKWLNDFDATFYYIDKKFIPITNEHP